MEFYKKHCDKKWSLGKGKKRNELRLVQKERDQKDKREEGNMDIGRQLEDKDGENLLEK